MAETQLDRIERALQRVEAKLATLTTLERAQLSEQLDMALSLDDITQKVTTIETVDQSAVTLIQQLAEMVRNLQPTQDAINALAGRLDASATALAAAVTANTPTAPTV